MGSAGELEAAFGLLAKLLWRCSLMAIWPRLRRTIPATIRERELLSTLNGSVCLGQNLPHAEEDRTCAGRTTRTACDPGRVGPKADIWPDMHGQPQPI
jgi:hypothetical protein